MHSFHTHAHSTETDVLRICAPVVSVCSMQWWLVLALKTESNENIFLTLIKNMWSDLSIVRMSWNHGNGRGAGLRGRKSLEHYSRSVSPMMRLLAVRSKFSAGMKTSRTKYNAISVWLSWWDGQCLVISIYLRRKACLCACEKVGLSAGRQEETEGKEESQGWIATDFSAKFLWRHWFKGLWFHLSLEQFREVSTKRHTHWQ